MGGNQSNTKHNNLSNARASGLQVMSQQNASDTNTLANLFNPPNTNNMNNNNQNQNQNTTTNFVPNQITSQVPNQSNTPVYTTITTTTNPTIPQSTTFTPVNIPMMTTTTTSNQTSVPLNYLIAFSNIINAPPGQQVIVSSFPRSIDDLISTWNQNGTRTIIVTMNPNNNREAIFRDPVSGETQYLTIGKGNYIIQSLDPLSNNPQDRSNMRIVAFGYMPNFNEINFYNFNGNLYRWQRVTSPAVQGSTSVNAVPMINNMQIPNGRRMKSNYNNHGGSKHCSKSKNRKHKKHH